jgi:hypothetical protein
MKSETVPGKTITSDLLTEAQARAIDPDAVPLVGSEQLAFSDEITPPAFDPYDPRWTT